MLAYDAGYVVLWQSGFLRASKTRIGTPRREEF